MKAAKYYLAAIFAYATWGFFSLVLKPLSGYSSVDILFYRIFSCAILMLLITTLFKRAELLKTFSDIKALPPRHRRNMLLLNVGGSIFLNINWFSFIYVLNHVSIKATSLAYLVCPIITTILACWLLHEKLNKVQWTAVGLSILGCLMLSYANIMDMVYGIVIGFTYAAYLVSQRKNAGFDKFILLTFHTSLSALMLLPFYPAYSGAVPTAALFWLLIEVIAVGFTVIPLFLNLYALKGLNSSTVGMLLNINPIIGFAIAVLVFHEPITPLQTAAYSTIFISVIVFNAHYLFKKKQRHLPGRDNADFVKQTGCLNEPS
ncbi:EamA family transporter [Pedobacter miscanthi]|uniref:EamA family transporter n=1 Tax=Pedobacter miscanthi TaxID=2259170 RepID=A0A366LCV5_9SPHI|nr:EamA family transporter [Pedobacter miscanthi]RBQ11711.1 EamA family transporter [Pedobacter miscanthi]